MEYGIWKLLTSTTLLPSPLIEMGISTPIIERAFGVDIVTIML